MKRVLFAFAALLAFSTVAEAQQHANQKKGFNANDVYQFNGLDTINAFNGNLTLSIPIGSTYSVGGGLSYGLTLYSNANLWEGQAHCHPESDGNCTTVCPRFDHLCAPQNRVLRNFMYPHRRANAGLGWTLSLGRLYQGGHPALLDGALPTYESPDGADHVFQGSSSTLAYTNDGSHLRLMWVPDLSTLDPNDCRKEPDLSTPDPNDTLCWQKIEFPNGDTHLFRPPTVLHDYYALDTITNRYTDNYVNVTYSAFDSPWPDGLRWTITDSHGRTHYVDFQKFQYDGEQRLLVKRVSLSVWDPEGDKATFEFEYSQQTLGRGEFQNDTLHGSSNYATVALLDRVVLPDATKFEFTYHAGGMLDNSNGVPLTMTVPTGGMVAWEWGPYLKPASSADNSEEYFRSSQGVFKRRLYGRVPAGGGSRPLEGTWSYDPMPTGVVTPGAQWPDCYHNPYQPQNNSFCHEYRTVITDPLGNKTVNYFAVNTQGETAPWLVWDYGLPFTKYTGDGTPSPNTRWLSSQVLNSSGTPLRSTFVRYEFDFPHRQVSRRVRYDDDQGLYVDSTSSGWDGFGHYRTQVTSSNIPGTPTRTSFTNYPSLTTAHRNNPAFPWILGLYDHTTVSENGKSLRTDFCFDANTGFLKQKRTRKDAAILGTNDLLAVFEPDARGNVRWERYYGGDLLPAANRVGAVRPAASVSTGDICSAVTGTLVYELGHTRVEPTSTTDGSAVSKYTGVEVNVSDVTIDRRSGLVSKSRDTAGVETSFEYDWAGRPAWEKPTGRAWTKYEFITPSSNEIKVSKYGANLTTPLLQTRYRIDALGRVDRETTTTPGNTEAARDTYYNALGWRTAVSEPGQTTALTFFSYDALGRVVNVTLPDASVTTTAYTGNRLKTRTSNIRTSTSSADVAVPVVEQYDGFGRLASVTEKSGPTTAASPIGALVTTKYEYDLADRLVSVAMNQSASPVQHRFFEYDGRGFLRWESQPEAGMTSYQYDARGNVVSKSQAADPQFDLDYFYDAAERLIRLEARNPEYPYDELPFRPLKEFVYGTANQTPGPGPQIDYAKGKLLEATRYNYLSLWRGKVTHRYRYLDAAGRREGRSTIIRHLDGDLWRTVDIATTYNELDLPTSVKYPMCIPCGYAPNGVIDRAGEIRTYDRGRLTSLSGFLSGVTYWPSGLRHVLSHVNGVGDTQLVGTMARPSSIAFGQYDHCVKPKFSTQPGGASVASGAAATLTASAPGTATVHYDWYRIDVNGELIDLHTDLWGTWIGSGTSVNVHPTATTEYVVKATNDCGETLSSKVKVTVTSCAAPEIKSITPVVQPDRSWILTPDLRVRLQSLSYEWRRLPNTDIVGQTETLPVGPLSATTTFSLKVSDSCGNTTANVTIVVPLSMTTTAFTATANANRTAITLSWPAVAGATSYHVWRRSGPAWEEIAAPGTPGYVDTSVAAGRVYAYKVVASGASNNSSNDSNTDVATTASLAPVAAGQVATSGGAETMLSAVNLARQAAGWPALTWNTILFPSEPVVVTGGLITARQLLACQARMSEALLALGARGGLFTDPGSASGIIRAVQIMEVQGAIE